MKEGSRRLHSLFRPFLKNPIIVPCTCKLLCDPLPQEGYKVAGEDREITGENTTYRGHFYQFIVFVVFTFYGVYFIIFLPVTSHFDLSMALKHISNCKSLLWLKQCIKPFRSIFSQWPLRLLPPYCIRPWFYFCVMHSFETCVKLKLLGCTFR